MDKSVYFNYCSLVVFIEIQRLQPLNMKLMSSTQIWCTKMPDFYFFLPLSSSAIFCPPKDIYKHMIRRTLKVQNSTVVTVEALSNASGPRSDGSFPRGILQQASATNLKTKTTGPTKQYLGHLNKLWLNRTRFLCVISTAQTFAGRTTQQFICHPSSFWTTSLYEHQMCQSGMRHCWTCYSQIKKKNPLCNISVSVSLGSVISVLWSLGSY